MPSHHMANMQLGHFVIRQVYYRIIFALQVGEQLLSIVAICRYLYPHEDLRNLAAAIAVIKFGDIALAQHPAEGSKTTRPFGNGDTDDGLALLANFGALGNIAQTVKVSIGTTVNGQQCLPLHSMRLNIFLQARQRQRPRRFGDGASVIKNILNRRTHLIAAGSDHLIDSFANHAKRLLADLRHRNTFRKDIHLRQGDPATFFQRHLQAGGTLRLHTNDFDLGPNIFDIGRHSRQQTATAYGDKYRIQRAGMLTQYFHADSALPGDHLWIIEGVNIN